MRPRELLREERDDSLMLAIICGDTWNMLNMQHKTPNSKRWGFSDIPSVAIKRLKDLPTWLKVATTLEKPATPTHISKVQWQSFKGNLKRYIQASFIKISLKTIHFFFQISQGSMGQCAYNSTCHPGSNYWDYPDALSLNHWPLGNLNEMLDM